jgi:hypothetical protein
MLKPLIWWYMKGKEKTKPYVFKGECLDWLNNVVLWYIVVGSVEHGHPSGILISIKTLHHFIGNFWVILLSF